MSQTISFEGTGPQPVFHTVQGEGIFVGRLSTFVRFYGCNQSCSWCDTKPSWNESMGQRKTVTYDDRRSVFSWDNEEVFPVRGNHIVITGGNPMLPQHRAAVRALLWALEHPAPTFTIETNAYGVDTIPTADDAKLAGPLAERLLWSLSPKLASWDGVAINGFLRFAYENLNQVQMKLVLTTVEELGVVQQLVASLSSRSRAVLESSTLVIQPEWSVTTKISQGIIGDPRLRLLSPYFNDVRVLPQVHKSLRIL